MNQVLKFTLIAFLCSCGIACAQKEVQESCRPANPIEVDGKMNDWTAEWSKDPDKKFFYNVCNDDENLYIRVKVNDGLTQVKVARFGFTIWMDPNGKRKRKYGLKYPTPEGRDFSRIEKAEENPDDKRTIEQKKLDMKRELIADTEVLELYGIAEDKIISARLGLMNGIKVIIVMDDAGDYFYEAKIPFKAYKLKKSEISTMSIGFETGKLTVTPPPNNTAPPPGGGFGPGGIRQFRSYSGGAQYSPMASETRLWFKLKLN